MSVWREIVEGFAEGFLTAAAYQSQVVPYHGGAGECGRIDRLCRELGWSVDERSVTENAVYLHFNTRYGLRRLRIADGEDSIVTFSAHSSAVIAARNVPADVLVYLLHRNVHGSGLGMWAMTVDDRNNVLFHLMYQPFGDGLDSEGFKYICESLINEAVDFDDKLRAAGLRR